MSKYRNIVMSKLINPPCPIALGISAAAPELPAGVDALLRHTLNHGLAADRTSGGVGLAALLGTDSQALSREAFGEATLILELIQQMFYLAAKHLNQPVAKYQ